MAIKQIYHVTSLTGGIDSTYLDYADGNSLSDKDRAFAIVSATLYLYELNATSGAAESSPNVIAPDTNAGTKRWILITAYSLTSVTTSVTQPDNTSSTLIATTAYAKSQDAVLAREPDQAVNLTAAASGSSGIAVADNANINFGTGNFTLVWKGSLPDWTPASSQYLLYKYAAPIGYRFRVDAAGALRLLILRTTAGTSSMVSSVVPPFVDGTVNEITVVCTRESISADGSGVFYVNGVQLGSSQPISAVALETLSNTSVLSVLGADAERTAGTVHHAYTLNFAPTAAEVLDMYRNGIPENLKWGSQTSISTSSFTNGAGGSAFATFDGASATGFHAISDGVTIDNAPTSDNIPIIAGHKYFVSWDMVLSAGTAPRMLVRGAVGSGTLHALVTDANTTKNVAFTATENDTALVYFDTDPKSVAEFTVSNFKLLHLGATFALLPESWQSDKPYDTSRNNLTCAYPASGWSLTRPTVLRASSLPALTAFVGTVSVSGTTVTFSSASDCALCNVGSTIVAGGDTRYITKLTNSTTLVIDQTASWSSTAITSIQAPQFVSGSNGTTRTFVAASGSVTTVLVSDGSILEHLTVDGKRGIGTTGPGTALDVVGTVKIRSAGYMEKWYATDNTTARGYLYSDASGWQLDNQMDGYIELLTNGSPKMTILSNGNVSIGTTDLDGTPAVGRLTIKGSTNDGSTYIDVWRDSDEANVASLDTNGNFYTVADVSALTFTDRTPFYEGDALAALATVVGKDGGIDHMSLPVFAQKKIRRTVYSDGLEVLPEDAFETVDIEEDEMEEITDEKGEAKKQPIVLSVKQVQKGFKLENNMPVPNIVEESVHKKVSKQVTRIKENVRFNDKTGTFHQREYQIVEEDGRDLGAMISILVKAIQQLQEGKASK